MDKINKEFGGRDLKSNNTIIVNSSDDPWQTASNTDYSRGPVTSYYIECPDCGHCTDLLTGF